MKQNITYTFAGKKYKNKEDCPITDPLTDQTSTDLYPNENKDNKVIVGIDPGASGGVAWIDQNTNIFQKSCPKTDIEMANLIKEIKRKTFGKLKAYIELVHAFPTDGRSSAFKFGKNYGTWLGILASFNIEPIFVTPQKWQKAYGELPKVKKERKNEMKKIASELSGLKATLKTSDAILITLYGYNWDTYNG